ncbi:MAG: flagellar basal body-associated FliL family protein [Vibrionaceae bacterium]
MLIRPLLLVVTLYLGLLAFAITMPAQSTEEPHEPPKPAAALYFTLEPAITTNYQTKGKKLGFINVRIDLVAETESQIKSIEYHQALIRDIIIETLSQQNAARIRSISGRDEIRKLCLERVQKALFIETNQITLVDLLFTHYLYQ